ncbi:DUF3558 domain-containing protein [Streptomyces sp. RB6PN25]|uniref:DUF3558 domain-containing protein n=1 Tax=Streptomyces humicola TaxID=2953240 RepID=A0ABT1PU41_9ACTN|nr:DUF3558 domain-containing protein [Streptomyces humicola]MCQ4081210.1 DUF3558 domain-containing protein [Streptomyces humicola]
MHRQAPRLALLLASATVPVMLVAGCSSGSGSSNGAQSGSGGAAASSSADASPSLAPAKYAKVPDPCKAINQNTVKSMVPSVKDAGGQPVASEDANDRGGCSWTGLDGYQYRYLDDSFQRFDSAPGGGSAEEQAASALQTAVQNAAKAAGAKTTQASGVGDEATLITWDANKSNTDYHYATVVARTSNVIVTVDFSGAGLEGDNKPKADQMNTDAQQAAKDAIASVQATVAGK